MSSKFTLWRQYLPCGTRLITSTWVAFTKVSRLQTPVIMELCNEPFCKPDLPRLSLRFEGGSALMIVGDETHLKCSRRQDLTLTDQAS